jgi:hypothetical protein
VPLFETLISLTLPEWCGEIADGQFRTMWRRKYEQKGGVWGTLKVGPGHCWQSEVPRMALNSDPARKCHKAIRSTFPRTHFSKTSGGAGKSKPESAEPAEMIRFAARHAGVEG